VFATYSGDGKRVSCGGGICSMSVQPSCAHIAVLGYNSFSFVYVHNFTSAMPKID